MRLVANVMSNNEIIYLKYLLPCLDKFCDDIVVVNTDGNEEVKKLVEKYDGKFLIFKNEGDCSAKRNHGLNVCADGDWILRIDTDEMPTYSFIKNIRYDLLEAEIQNVDRILVGIFHLTDFLVCKEESGIELRLFKKNKTCRYEGKTHEILACDYFPGLGATLPDGDVLVHFKYMDTQKTRDNIRDIREGKLFYDPKDLRRRLTQNDVPLPVNFEYPIGRELYAYFLRCRQDSRKEEREFINE
jgi:hypothetical protein